MGLDNPLHWAVILVLLLVLFGARRLPEIGRSLGSGMREFKDSISGESKAPTLSAGQQQPQATPQPPQAPAAQAPPAQSQQPAAPPPPPQQPTPEPVAAPPGVPNEQQSNPFGG
jgi:sec-independent protein translocase protein TatA